MAKPINKRLSLEIYNKKEGKKMTFPALAKEYNRSLSTIYWYYMQGKRLSSYPQVDK